MLSYNNGAALHVHAISFIRLSIHKLFSIKNIYSIDIFVCEFQRLCISGIERKLGSCSSLVDTDLQHDKFDAGSEKGDLSQHLSTVQKVQHARKEFIFCTEGK